MRVNAATGDGTVTAGTLLGGRVQYAQLVAGYRTGIEPVLLAASLKLAPGARVLEAGTGAGAGLLCLAARVAGITGVGVEIDPDLAGVARANVAANQAQITILTADILAVALDGPFDHAFANPPWHNAASTPSAEPGRARAKIAQPGLTAQWVAAMARVVRPRGTVQLILPACRALEGAAALAGNRCGGVDILPLWPRAGRQAKLIILRGVVGGRGATRVLPGLILHGADGYTADADAVLRDGGALG